MYGDNAVLVALARLHKLEVNVHQIDQPVWKVSGVPSCSKEPVRQIHLSYHNGEHYSSVRPMGDTTDKPTSIHIAGTAPIVNRKDDKPKYSYACETYDEYDVECESESVEEVPAAAIDHIISVTNSCDLSLIKDIYAQSSGDLELTISTLMSMLTVDESNEATNETSTKKNKRPTAKDKKLLKKQRQMERQRTKVLEERESLASKPSNSKCAAEAIPDSTCSKDTDDFKITLSNVEATNI